MDVHWRVVRDTQQAGRRIPELVCCDGVFLFVGVLTEMEVFAMVFAINTSLQAFEGVWYPGHATNVGVYRR